MLEDVPPLQTRTSRDRLSTPTAAEEIMLQAEFTNRQENSPPEDLSNATHADVEYLDVPAEPMSHSEEVLTEEEEVSDVITGNQELYSSVIQ